MNPLVKLMLDNMLSMLEQVIKSEGPAILDYVVKGIEDIKTKI